MPASQLKQLKASLRDQGIIGPQKSKKQKRQLGKSNATRDRGVARNEALENIRDRFNPFEKKAPPRGSKFQFANGQNGPTTVGRPGVTKGLGEEARRKTLLVEMQKRQKVGGITDRRFGENDPTMTPEERALERFVKEKQRGTRKNAIFDLEDDDDGVEELTHLGRSLDAQNGAVRDDFLETVFEDTDSEGQQRGGKRRRLSNTNSNDIDGVIEADLVPDRPKTRQEVMKEVIAKSKLHKYERQKAREDDDDLRAELDQGVGDLYALLRGTKPTPKPTPHSEPSMNPDRAALLNGKAREQADKEYDERMRQMAFDLRSKPSTRTKTEEQIAEEEARKLRELEEQRRRRMEGEDTDDEESNQGRGGDDDFFDDEMIALGNGPNGSQPQPIQRGLGVEDEDDFVLDDNLVASESEPDLAESDVSSSGESADEADEEEREFAGGLPTNSERGTSPENAEQSNGYSNGTTPGYTFPCPHNLTEFLRTTKGIPFDQLPTVVQRIRALHHPKLDAANKEKLETFSAVLVEYIPYLTNFETRPPFATIEQLIRHAHSLAKSFPEKVSEAFRDHLRIIHKERPKALNAGDLMILVAIGSIFPTSDHWHQVTTPAMLTMARYLEHAIPGSVADLSKGLYIGTLCIQYQTISKRYVPEVVNYVLNVIHMLSPSPPREPFGLYPDYGSPELLRIGSSGEPGVLQRKSNFWDIAVSEKDPEVEEVKMSILYTSISLISIMADLWMDKTAYYEIMQPFSVALCHLTSKACKGKLPAATKESITNIRKDLDAKLSQALQDRRPLALHNHRPLAIKTSIPKFEESYHPGKHYDPDRDRSELAKLKAEHKRERKGAMRELRKDANFIAREKLREKKEKDEAYEKKYRRLVAEIQGEEGREKKEYEREKRARKRKGGR